MNLTQQRFKGFCATPFLWEESLTGIQQLNLENNEFSIAIKIPDTIRLGNFVEQLVFFQLERQDHIEILLKNKQVFHDKITLGEIDCLLLHYQQPIHLEIAYKFYLYDEKVGDNFLEHWIGPNRRDSLVQKLNKIKEKQFPLLYSKECETLIAGLNLDSKMIQQKTFFKAQLFTPYHKEVEFHALNTSCVQGFYISLKDLQIFSECKFYIPKKLDWIITPHTNVTWLSFKETLIRIREFHKQKSAPLCWMKRLNGEIEKLFVVWWC